MLRFFTHLLGKPYETCKSCETLKIQLELANERENKLLERLLNLTEPEVIQTPSFVPPVRPKLRTFREVARIAEENDRIKTGQVQTIEKLEKELAINAEKSAS